MKIELNKVTRLSKLVALGLFVALPFIGFYYGIRYGEILASLANTSGVGATALTGNNIGNNSGDYYKNVSEWQTDKRDNAGFALSYPLDFVTNDIYSATPVTDWRQGANGGPGAIFFTLIIPKAFEPQTNFDDAKLTVASSHNKKAIADCLAPDASGGPAAAVTSTATINGIAFTIFSSSDAGAGNYYETKSYRALHAGQCYAIEYTIHSSQIMNYPAEYNLHQFDKAKLTDVLDRIVGTFKFL